MKKLFYLLICILVLASCKKDEEITTYQVYNILEGFDQGSINFLFPNDPGVYDYIDGTLHEVRVYEYNGSKVISRDSIGEITSKGGMSQVITTKYNCNEVRVTFRFLSKESPYYNLLDNHRFQFITNTSLRRDENNIVFIKNGLSLMSSFLTK